MNRTLQRIVRDVNPTVICLCQESEFASPLCQIQQLESGIMHSWIDAATEHWTDAATESIQLRSMFTAGSAYVTIHMVGLIECSNHQILHPLYSAQTFVCSLPDGESVKVINVHAPSGARRLTHQRRKTLLTNLIQSESQARPGHPIGNVTFVIGGDMNTKASSMSRLLQECFREDTLVGRMLQESLPRPEIFASRRESKRAH